MENDIINEIVEIKENISEINNHISNASKLAQDIADIQFELRKLNENVKTLIRVSRE